MYTPLNYEQINLVESSVIPSTLKVKNTVAFNFWCRALYQRLLSLVFCRNLSSNDTLPQALLQQ